MHIIIFGDSIAQGFFDTDNCGWGTLLSLHLQQKTLDSKFETYYSVFNQSISDENTSEICERFKKEINPRLATTKKNIVIFAGGINDAKRLLPSDELYVPLNRVQKNVNEFISEARVVADEILIVGLIRVDESFTTSYNSDAFHNSDIELYDQAIQECAEKNSVKYIPVHDVVQSEHLADGLHPNSEGHKRMFERIKSTLEAEGIL